MLEELRMAADEELYDELSCAVGKGDVDEVRLLLERKDMERVIARKCCRLTRIAVANDHLGIVTQLIDKGVDVDPVGDSYYTTTSILVLAAANGHCDVIKFLLANGAVVDGEGWRTPLSSAE